MINKIGKILKSNWRLILIFILTFLIYMFFGFYINNGDPTASYGFSHAIRNGQIIYKDFNTISTPLYAFYCSSFLFIYDDFIMFIFAQTLLITFMFYFLFRMYDNKAWIIFLSMILFKFMGFNATYNFCCLAMSVVVLYLEVKLPKKDFLIGLFLGLTFLSKQTVGGLFFLPSFIICFKEGKRLGKRVLGFLIPNLVLIIYLVCNNALYQFIDLCFLGLFDFGGNNSYFFTIWFFLVLVLLIINIILIVKDRRNTDYYGLSYLGFVIPIFDLNHFSYYFVGFSIILIAHLKVLSKYKMVLVVGMIFEVILFNWLMGIRDNNAVFYKDISHFKFKYNYELDYKTDKKLSNAIDEYIECDPILIMYYSMSYNISHERDISYFDIFLYGNHGYNGTKKMIDKVENMKNQYFIINMEEYEYSKNEGNQFNYEIVDYIIFASELIDSREKINVYYKE